MAGGVKMPIEQVRPGMCLGEALRDANGVVLLPEGTVLGESHLASCLRRGVAWVVVTPPDGEDAPDETAWREAVAARLARLFRHGGDGEADRVLYQAIFEYHLGRMP